VVEAIKAMQQGKVVVVTDDESRENEGDLIMAAQLATPETIGFIVRHSSGIICTPLTGSRLDALKLPPMTANNEDPKETAFAVSVDYKHGTTTGISAADRAATFRALADPASTADDFFRPGHVFPLRPRDGGVLVRDGHTEATMDLCRLAGLSPCGVLCEVVNDDGSMARVPDLIKFCTEHSLVLTSIADLIGYVKQQQQAGRLEALGWATEELQAAELLQSMQEAAGMSSSVGSA
jgi:3,4-dihydroxy 2-butanone 4-phosphate synthase/GTP cyclohydrolase II